MFARVDIGKTEFPTKAAEKKVVEKLGLRFVSKVGVRIPFPVFSGDFSFFNQVQLAPLARRRAVPTTESEWVPVKSVRLTKWRRADVPE